MFTRFCNSSVFSSQRFQQTAQYEVVCYSRNTQPIEESRPLVGAITSLVARLTALATNSLIRAITSKMTRLIAVSADSFVLAVASNVSLLQTITADNLTRAVTSNVSFKATITAHNESVSSSRRTALSLHDTTQQIHTFPRGSQQQYDQAGHNCSTQIRDSPHPD